MSKSSLLHEAHDWQVGIVHIAAAVIVGMLPVILPDAGLLNAKVLLLVEQAYMTIRSQNWRSKRTGQLVFPGLARHQTYSIGSC